MPDLGFLITFIFLALSFDSHAIQSKTKKTTSSSHRLRLESVDQCQKPLWDAKKAAGKTRGKSPSSTAPGNFFTLYDGKQSIYRGRNPSTSAHMDFLKKKGVKKILIFKDWKAENERLKLEERYLDAGFKSENLSWIAFPWSNTRNYKKLCLQSLEGLRVLKQTVDDSRRSQGSGNLFLHCTAGEDRTGFLSGLFRMLKNDWSISEAYQKEMCARGYADGNPKKPYPVAEEVQLTLTPLFEDFARLIKSGDLNWESLDPNVCDDLRAKRGKTTLPRCSDEK